MNVRIMRAQGDTDDKLCAYIEDRIQLMRDGYWLHDLDPQQYENQARRIWQLELAGECP
jgi:hypothetical protein